MRTDFPKAYARQFLEDTICELTDTFLSLGCENRPDKVNLDQFCDAWTDFQHRLGNASYTKNECKNDETIANEQVDKKAFSCVTQRDDARNYIAYDGKTYARCYYGGASSSESVL